MPDTNTKSMQEHANSFEPDVLAMHPEKVGRSGCRSCGGVGYYYDPLGAGPREGAFILCDCMKEVCRCERRPPHKYYDPQVNAMVECPAAGAERAIERSQLLQKASGIPRRYQWRFISSIDTSDQSMLLAVDFAMETIKRFGQGDVRGLYLHGNTGCGKTLLACAILNELVRLYQAPVTYAKISRDILGRLKASFNPNSEYYGEGRSIEEKLATVPALVIDDFGAHRETDWVNTVLYDLIDARYEHDLLTILTSNEPISSWRDISAGRVFSRLREMCTEVHVEAEDFRLRKTEFYGKVRSDRR